VVVKTGQVNDVRQLAYRPADAARGQVETMPFQMLRRLNDGATQRGDFHVLAVVERGRGSVSIDFTTPRWSHGRWSRFVPGSCTGGTTSPTSSGP